MLKIGHYLNLKKRNVQQNEDVYRCRIIDVSPEEIFIDAPINEKTNKTEYFKPGTMLKAMYLDGKKVFSFATNVTERRNGQIPMLLLKYPEEEAFAQIQRRNFLRIEANIDIAVHSLDDVFKPFTTLTSDIGGGGVQVVLPDDHLLSVGDRLMLWIVLPMQSDRRHYLKVDAETVRIFTDKYTNKPKASFSFGKLDDKTREPLIRYCFEQERRLRNKSLHPERL